MVKRHKLTVIRTRDFTYSRINNIYTAVGYIRKLLYDSKRLGCHFESFQTLLMMHPSGEKKVKTDTLPNTCIFMYK